MHARYPIKLPRVGDQLLDIGLDDVSEMTVEQAEQVITTLGDTVTIMFVRREGRGRSR